MNAEQRAAELLLARKLGTVTEELCSAGVVLAQLYDREHPADDGEPVTPDWLRSVGFTDYLPANEFCSAYLSFWLDRREHNVALLAVAWARPDNPHGQKIYWSCQGFSLYKPAYPKTRGDVRRLLAALGVTTN